MNRKSWNWGCFYIVYDHFYTICLILLKLSLLGENFKINERKWFFVWSIVTCDQAELRYRLSFASPISSVLNRSDWYRLAVLNTFPRPKNLVLCWIRGYCWPNKEPWPVIESVNQLLRSLPKKEKFSHFNVGEGVAKGLTFKSTQCYWFRVKVCL